MAKEKFPSAARIVRPRRLRVARSCMHTTGPACPKRTLAALGDWHEWVKVPKSR